MFNFISHLGTANQSHGETAQRTFRTAAPFWPTTAAAQEGVHTLLHWGRRDRHCGKLNTGVPYDPAIPLLALHPAEKSAHVR